MPGPRAPQDDDVVSSFSPSTSVAAAMTCPPSAGRSMAVLCQNDSRPEDVGQYVVGAVDPQPVVGANVRGRPVGLIVGGYVESSLTSKRKVSPLP